MNSCRPFVQIREKYNFTWIFHLDPQLSLNLTIWALLIISEKACNTGSLVVSNAKNSITQLKYCEHHARFSVFADFYHVEVKIIIFRCKLYKFNSDFLVYDKGLFSSLSSLPHHSKDNCNKPTEPDKSCQFIFGLLTRWSCAIFVYIIQMGKLHQVVIKIIATPFKYFVFDSPQILKRIIKPIRGKYFCSTFQCLVQLLSCSFQNYVQIYFTHKTIPPTIVLSLQKEDIFVNLPMINCAQSICIVHAEAQRGFKTNVTVLGIEYQGPGTFLCKFGGFAIPHLFDDLHKQNVILCTNYSGHEIQKRGYFSNKASISIILFWYDTISSITASFCVSQIDCELVTQNLCSDDVGTFVRSNFIDTCCSPNKIIALDDGKEYPIDKCLILDLFAFSSKYRTDHLSSRCPGHLTHYNTIDHIHTRVQINGFSAPSHLLETNAARDYGCDELYAQSYLKIAGHFDVFCKMYSLSKECGMKTNSSSHKILVFGAKKFGFQIKAQISMKSIKRSIFHQGQLQFKFKSGYQLFGNSQSWLQVLIQSWKQKNYLPPATTIPAQIEVSLSLFGLAHKNNEGERYSNFYVKTHACKDQNLSCSRSKYCVVFVQNKTLHQEDNMLAWLFIIKHISHCFSFHFAVWQHYILLTSIWWFCWPLVVVNIPT